MVKKKERDVLSIEIRYDETEELDALIKSNDFHKLLLDEAITTIEHALTKNVNLLEYVMSLIWSVL